MFAQIGQKPPVHLATLELAPTYAEPVATFRMMLSEDTTLYALSYCNIRGLWENSVEVKIA